MSRVSYPGNIGDFWSQLDVSATESISLRVSWYRESGVRAVLPMSEIRVFQNLPESKNALKGRAFKYFLPKRKGSKDSQHPFCFPGAFAQSVSGSFFFWGIMVPATFPEKKSPKGVGRTQRLKNDSTGFPFFSHQHWTFFWSDFLATFLGEPRHVYCTKVIDWWHECWLTFLNEKTWWTWNWSLWHNQNTKGTFLARKLQKRCLVLVVQWWNFIFYICANRLVFSFSVLIYRTYQSSCFLRVCVFAFCHCWNLLRNQGLSNKMIPPHFRQTLQKTKVAKVYHSPNEMSQRCFCCCFSFSAFWQLAASYKVCAMSKKGGLKHQSTKNKLITGLEATPSNQPSKATTTWRIIPWLVSVQKPWWSVSSPKDRVSPLL